MFSAVHFILLSPVIFPMLGEELLGVQFSPFPSFLEAQILILKMSCFVMTSVLFLSEMNSTIFS